MGTSTCTVGALWAVQYCMPIVSYKIWQNNTKRLFALKCEKCVNIKVSLCVFLCFSLGSAMVSKASCPSGIHNKASCSTLWGRGRGSTMATIWALWGTGLWNSSSEHGKFRTMGNIWAPERAPGPYSSKSTFFTRVNSNVVILSSVHK